MSAQILKPERCTKFDCTNYPKVMSAQILKPERCTKFDCPGFSDGAHVVKTGCTNYPDDLRSRDKE